MTTIVALSSGLSQPSSTRLLAERMAQATRQALGLAGEHTVEVELVDLKDFAHDIVDHMLTGFGSARLEDLKSKVVAADGIIAVTPIFSQSFSGLFKSFLDILDTKSLINTPVFLGATAGTARHSLALEYAIRPVFAYFRAATAPTAVFAASEDWGDGGQGDADLMARVDRGAGEFAALITGRLLEPVAEIDEFETPDFESLLKQVGAN